MPKAKPQQRAQNNSIALVPVERVTRFILIVRGQKVLLDSDLAELYGVPVKRLNEAVKRNRDRFPNDFMFQLTWEELGLVSRSQIATLKPRQSSPQQLIPKRGGNVKYLPHAFTEHGAVMLASVLRSPTAVAVSVQVVRAFVSLRQMIASNEKMRRKLAQIERKLNDHDQHFAAVFNAIRQLMDEQDEDEIKKPRIGYHSEAQREK